jgi:hypothetical protein
MVSNNILEFKRKRESDNKTAECWHRIYLIMRQIPDDQFREESLSFWRQKVPIVLGSSL